MYSAKGIAASGLRKQQTRIETIANNIANLNTTAFKAARLDFKDSMYVNGFSPAPARTPEGHQQKGHGVLNAGITTDFSPGTIIRTERELDLAIENEGFFAIGDLIGNTFYTRNGNFGLSAEPGGTFLVNAEGLYLQDMTGARIQVPEGTHRIDIGTNGAISFAIGDTIQPGATIGIFTFRNLAGLESVGSSNFAETESSGDRLPAEEARVRQGTLEGSNVSLADEMARLLRTQRAFSLASRALTTADEMEGIANNMRR